MASDPYTDVIPAKAVRRELSKASRDGQAGIQEQSTATGWPFLEAPLRRAFRVTALTRRARNDGDGDQGSAVYLAMPPTLARALSIGARAPCRFTHGSVHSVYRQACNIELEDGALVTLLGREPGNVPHGIRCALPQPADFRAWLRPTQAVAADGLSLHVPAAGIAIDLSAAVRWHCGLRRCAIDLRAEPTVHALRSLRTVLREQGPRSGFAPLLLLDATPGSPLDRAMRRRLMQALPALSCADADLDFAAAAQALAPLAGLGPGLTPSGDDFIVGYLAALYGRCSCEPRLRPYLSGLYGPVMQFALTANLISRQYLLNALAGEFSESLAQVVVGIAGNDDLRLRESTARLVRVGHSSGADSLLGLLFGLCPAFVLADPAAAGLVAAASI